MITDIIFILLLVYILIRTIAYGIYSIKESGIVGGISVFILGLCIVITGYMTLFRIQL